MAASIATIYFYVQYYLPRVRFSRCSERRESDFKELIHALDIFDKVEEFGAEDLEGVSQNGAEVSLTVSDQTQLFLKS